MVGGAREGSWFGRRCWVVGGEGGKVGAWCLGATRLCSSTGLRQNHVSRLLPWQDYLLPTRCYFISVSALYYGSAHVSRIPRETCLPFQVLYLIDHR